ncbi:MAG: hypothetical protein C4315_07750, partial [Chloroflexota bacterium]
MPFTVEDFRDLIKLLEAHPEWRAELRRMILTEELLLLPGELSSFRQEVLERFDRVQGPLARLAEAQARTEERV